MIYNRDASTGVKIPDATSTIESAYAALAVEKRKSETVAKIAVAGVIVGLVIGFVASRRI